MALGYVPREVGDAMMTEAQSQALAAFVTRARPEWDHAGIMAAIRKAADLGSPAAIGAALCRLAENYEIRTPALLAEPGKHWAGTTVASRQPPTMCPEPGHEAYRALECNASGPCAAAAREADHAAGAARVRAEFRATRHTTPRREPATPAATDLTDARQRAEQEQP